MFPAVNHTNYMDAFRPSAPGHRSSVRSGRLVALLLIGWVGGESARALAASAPDETASPTESKLKTTTNAPAAELAQELRWLKAERVFITSVSKREEDPFTTAAAVSVITGDDIRRSGARSIPEVLRLAPGINVAQLDANKWAVSSRGFTSRFADKLLVLIDGRSVYSPTFSGVFWDTQDYLFEDIDRIEVIRGPGGTIWGANAVNGVINIITKDSKDTVGTFVSGGYGTEDRGFGEFRYGAQTGESGFMRGYFKYHNTDNLDHGFDAWDFMQGGLRGDWTFGPTKLSLSADAYHGNERQEQVTARLPAVPFTGPVIATNRESYLVDGQNVMVRMEHEIGYENSLQLQGYFDRYKRGETYFDSVQNTFDVDFQHRFPLPWRQNFTYGLGYRYLPDHLGNRDPGWINYSPTERHWQVFSGFVQDDLELIEDRVHLTLGTKLEHNDSTGFEYQPSVRLALTPNARHTLWGAVSRAVQVPGRNFDAIQSTVLPTLAAFPLSVVGAGSRNLKSTEMMGYELGHRWQPNRVFSVDSTVFYQHYDRLIDGLPTVDLTDATLRNSSINQGSADTYGFEFSSIWNVTDWWRLSGAYTWFKANFHDSTTSLFGEGSDPRNTGSLRASFDLPGGLELDVWARYVDQLPSFNVPSYTDLDLRLGWHATENLEFSVVGQNLLSPSRAEFSEEQFNTTLVNFVQRAVYAQVSLRF
jgi:iron complex outermembrane recepter protein